MRVPVRRIDRDDDDDDDFDAELFGADFVAAVDDFFAAGDRDAEDEDLWGAVDDGGPAGRGWEGGLLYRVMVGLVRSAT